jgi:ubiquitin carboxyl-terminal hydrolase 2/21
MADIFKGSKLSYCQESVMKGQLAKAYGDLLDEMWDEGSVSVSPTGFKSQIQKYAKHFMGHDQQDCQEFLRFLLSGLHKDLNSPVSFKDKGKGPNSDDKLAEYSWRKYLSFESSPISDLFMGQLKSTLVCEKCKQRSVTFDPFWDLSPPMKRLGIGVGAVKVTDCLKEFTTKMKLEGQESAYCDKCDSLEEAEKTLEIQKLPKILVLHLNRFAGLRFRSKLDIPIDIPLQLEMGPYLVNKSGATLFSLYGVTNHSGTAYGGHYTALCKHVHSGQWYSFNDSQVNPHGAPGRPSTQAYVLFYSRKDQN